MRIYINGKPLEVSLYDDDSSILEKWSLLHPDTLPEYFRLVEKEDYTLKKDVRLKVEDVRDVLKDTSIEEMAETDFLLRLSIDYPRLSRKEVTLLKLYLTYGDVSESIISLSLAPQEEYLRKIDRTQFHNIREVTRKYLHYPETVKKRRESSVLAVKELGKIEKELNTVSPVEYSPFSIEEVTRMLIFELPDGESLIDIFDEMRVSEVVPFIHLRTSSRDYYKILDSTAPREEWLVNSEEDGIYFWLRSTRTEKCFTKETCQSQYSQGLWREDNRVEITFTLGVVNELELKEKFMSILNPDSLRYRLIHDTQTSVKGKFTVRDFPFNKAIFADMVSGGEVDGQPSILSHFFFFNERQQKFMEGYKSAITKKRFMMYYQPRHTFSISRSLGVIVTPYLSDDGKISSIDVRVSRAINRHQVESFQEVFSRLLSIYTQTQEVVMKDYINVLPSAKSLLEKYSTRSRKIATKKEDKKSGIRLRELKEKRPETFRSGYASMCQPMSHQPYLISSPEEAERIRQEYGEHKVMEFTDLTGRKDFYACEPREDGEIKSHIYPGLRENVSKNPEYRSQVPFVPCCFTEDQYTKPAAELHKRIEAEKGGQQSYIDEATLQDTGHILAYNKMVPRGRFGQIPYYLTFIARSAGYQDIEKGKQSILPIFRHGVLDAPDSFLHCLEKAFNPRYSSLERKGRLELISRVRRELSEMDFSVAKQELYDYTDEMIREALLDESRYLDPGVWLRLAEIHYKCNIFLYEISKNHPNGEIVIPRFSQAYLFRDISETEPSVLIVRNEVTTLSSPYPYQCELVVKFDPSDRTQRYVYVFRNDPLIGKAIQFLYDSVNIYVTTPRGMTFHAPVQLQGELFEGVEKQYIDSAGKCRALIYSDGVTLMTSPLPPLNLRRVSKLPKPSSIQEVRRFVKQKGLSIVSQTVSNEENRGGIRGIWIEPSRSQNSGIYYGYIPVESTDLIPKIPLTSENILPPLSSENTLSELRNMNYLRKLSEFLQNYTFFEYSRDPEGFGSDSFIVDEEHTYNLDSLRKRLIPNNDVMYRGGKLIVPSKQVLRKLLAVLRVRLLNDTPGVMEYAHRTIIPDYYRSLRDFRSSPQQLLFLNRSSMERWRLERSFGGKMNIYSVLIPDTQEPYFYRNSNIAGGKIALIQNVEKGELARALGVGERWLEDRVNPGYFGEGFRDSPENPVDERRRSSIRKKMGYVVYTEEGKVEAVGKGGEKLHILRYSEDRYAAILFL